MRRRVAPPGEATLGEGDDALCFCEYNFNSLLVVIQLFRRRSDSLSAAECLWKAVRGQLKLMWDLRSLKWWTHYGAFLFGNSPPVSEVRTGDAFRWIYVDGIRCIFSLPQSTRSSNFNCGTESFMCFYSTKCGPLRSHIGMPRGRICALESITYSSRECNQF